MSNRTSHRPLPPPSTSPSPVATPPNGATGRYLAAAFSEARLLSLWDELESKASSPLTLSCQVTQPTIEPPRAKLTRTRNRPGRTVKAELTSESGRKKQVRATRDQGKPSKPLGRQYPRRGNGVSSTGSGSASPTPALESSSPGPDHTGWRTARKTSQHGRSADTSSPRQLVDDALESRPLRPDILGRSARLRTDGSGSSSGQAPTVRWKPTVPRQEEMSHPSSSAVTSGSSQLSTDTSQPKSKSKKSRGKGLDLFKRFKPDTTQASPRKSSGRASTSPRQLDEMADRPVDPVERERDKAFNLKATYKARHKDGENAGQLKSTVIKGDLIRYFGPTLAGGDISFKERVNGHVAATRIVDFKGTAEEVEQARKSLYDLILHLNACIRNEEDYPVNQQQTELLACARAFDKQLKQEMAMLRGLSDTLAGFQAQGAGMAPGTRLIDAMALVGASASETQAWLDSGYDLGHAAKAALGGVTLAELKGVAGKHADDRGTIECLLRARQLYPELPKDRFLEAATTIASEKVSAQALEAMRELDIPLHPENLPGHRLGKLASKGTSQKLGQGKMTTVYKFRSLVIGGTGQWAFKPSSNKAPDIATIAGIPEEGANLSARIVATGKASTMLGIRSAPMAHPVMLKIPASDREQYGTLSELVKGEMVESKPGDTARLPLSTMEMQAVLKMPPQQLDRLAQTHGFYGCHVDETSGTLNFITTQPQTPEQLLSKVPPVQTQFMQDLDFSSPALLESLSNLGWLGGITGQMDMHGGNIILTANTKGQPEVQTIDNDASGGKLAVSAYTGIALPNPVIEEWNQYLTRMAKEADASSLPKPPGTVGRLQRAELLAMDRQEFKRRHGQGLDPDQLDRAWARMEQVQRQLKSADMRDGRKPKGTRIAEVNDWVPTVNGDVFAYGWPNVISASLKVSILALTEREVKETMYGGLGPDEQDAAWSRVQEAQRHLQQPGLVAVIDDPADWTSKSNLRRQGLLPEQLADAVQKLESLPDHWAERGFRRQLAIDHGITGVLAASHALSTNEIQRFKKIDPAAPLPRFQSLALFNPTQLKAELFGH